MPDLSFFFDVYTQASFFRSGTPSRRSLVKFAPMSELLRQAAGEGYAVPSFCVWNAESMEVVMRTAEKLKAPVILMNGPGEFGLLSPQDLGAVAHALAERFEVRAALHLDHGNSLEQVKACLAAKYTSVMLDYSARPFAENVAALRQAVALAHPQGATVEGELGLIGQVDQVTVETSGQSTLTDPGQAAEFVDSTGIDALAVSIGNAHGCYTKLPQLDFDRLAKLKSATHIPLVLHGGSGTPPADLHRAITLGIAKVNVATESINAVRQSLMEQWNSGINLWTPIAQAVAMEAMAGVVGRWCHLTGAAGRA
jgi:ketose-bisphosphate aldolase